MRVALEVSIKILLHNPSVFRAFPEHIKTNEGNDSVSCAERAGIKLARSLKRSVSRAILGNTQTMTHLHVCCAEQANQGALEMIIGMRVLHVVIALLASTHQRKESLQFQAATPADLVSTRENLVQMRLHSANPAMQADSAQI